MGRTLGMSVKEIAAAAGSSLGTARKYLKLAGIKLEIGKGHVTVVPKGVANKVVKTIMAARAAKGLC